MVGRCLQSAHNSLWLVRTVLGGRQARARPAAAMPSSRGAGYPDLTALDILPLYLVGLGLVSGALGGSGSVLGGITWHRFVPTEKPSQTEVIRRMCHSA